MGSHWSETEKGSSKMGSDELTKEIVAKAFAKADENGTGELDANQLKVTLLELMETGSDACFITDKEMLDDEKTMKIFVAVADRDEDNLINLDELLYILDLGDEKPDEKEMFKKMLKASDQDRNGFISADELKTFALTLKLEEEDEIDDMVKMFTMMADVDGDRRLSIDELLTFFTEGPKKEDPKEEMKRMFRMHDTNGDGFISKKEVLGFFKMMGIVDEDDTPAEARMMINMMVSQCDEDKDGKLSYEEFSKLMGH